MADLQRTFLAGKMNKDLDERLVPDGEYRDALNITIDTSEGSNIGAVQNSLGNSKIIDISNILLGYQVAAPINPVTIGALSYESLNLIYWFVKADNFEGIFEYNQITSTSVLVLGSTSNQLGFSRNNLITGVNYVTDGRGNGLLIWTDNLNPPRKINISDCKSWSVDDPRIDIGISLIVAPPLHSPYIKLNTITLPSSDPNNIEDKFVYFSYRYKYSDNEYSAMSPLSAVSFDPKLLSVDSDTGDNKGMLNKFNQVEVTFETGNEFVKEIQLLVWESRTLNVKIVETLKKAELNIDDNSTYSFKFMNNKTYAALPSDQVTRLFDNVPLKAQAQEIIGSRLVFGNYTQFRDLIDTTNKFIDINYSVDFKYESVTADPKQTWRSDRDYEVGISYLDEYGRMTTVLTTSSDNTNNNLSNSVYIPSANSSTANSLRLNIKNNAPSWAHGYRFFIKQSKGEYYNIFPTTYVVDGSYRYFLINESDRDKIKVNGYIIFKTSGSGPTNSNKKFKVLELDYKAAGFNNITSALEGLYFKIKASSSDTFLSAVNQQSASFTGSGRGPKQSQSQTQTLAPVRDRGSSTLIETVFYSHTGDNTVLPTGPQITYVPTGSSSYGDWRISIEILPNNQYRWTSHPNLISWSAPANIVPGVVSVIPFGGPQLPLQLDVNFQSGNYTAGDRWVFNMRGYWGFSGTVVASNQQGSFGLPMANVLTYQIGNIPPSSYGGHCILKADGPIYPGAQIDIQVEYDSDPQNPQRSTGIQQFTSSDYYATFEEWFYESGAYSSFIQYNQANINIGAKGVVFRRGSQYGNAGNPLSNYIKQASTGTMYMLLQGFGNGGGNRRNEIKANIKITQTPTNKRLTAETVPSINDTDIYYEMSRTYQIKDGKHMSLWQYDQSSSSGGNTTLTQTSKEFPHYFTAGQTVYVTAPNIPGNIAYTVGTITSRYSISINVGSAGNFGGGVSDNIDDQDQTSPLNGAVVILNNTSNKNSDYNAYCYGNGVESNRILDGYNEPWLKYSLRASGIIEDYQEQVKDASLTYSGLYRWDSSINRLNEFNLSTANFKNLDKNFGSVQKIYARTTDLLVLHQDKITSVLYGKNLLVDAVGGSSVASVPEVLGTQIAYPYEFGISNNPESFATYSENMYFTDARRGVVLQMVSDQVIQISRNGMSDYFRDMMADSSEYAKLGAYDPHNNTYVISSTSRKNVSCDIQITPDQNNFAYNTSGSLQYLFSITGTSAWSVSVIDNGYGTNWVELPPYCQSGVGSKEISARIQNNTTNLIRRVIFRVFYCDTYVDFTLTQGVGPKTDFNILIL